MTKKGGKKYRCYLPKEPSSAAPEKEEEDAPPPHMANYLSSLIDSCFYRLEVSRNGPRVSTCLACAEPLGAPRTWTYPAPLCGFSSHGVEWGEAVYHRARVSWAGLGRCAHRPRAGVPCAPQPSGHTRQARSQGKIKTSLSAHRAIHESAATPPRVCETSRAAADHRPRRPQPIAGLVDLRAVHLGHHPSVPSGPDAPNRHPRSSGLHQPRRAPIGHQAAKGARHGRHHAGVHSGRLLPGACAGGHRGRSGCRWRRRREATGVVRIQIWHPVCSQHGCAAWRDRRGGAVQAAVFRDALRQRDAVRQDRPAA